MNRLRAPLLLLLACCWSGWAAPVLAGMAGPYRFGIYLPSLRDANPVDVKVNMDDWVAGIGRNYGMEAHVNVYDSMAQMREAADRGEIETVNASGIELAQMFPPGTRLRGVTSYMRGVGQGLVLLVAAQSGVRTFPALAGKRLAWVGKDKFSEVYLDVQCMRHSKQPCASWLKLGMEKRDLSAIHKVFFGQADAALVSRAAWAVAVELNPQLAQRMQVLQEFRVEALNFGIMLPRLSESEQTRVIDVILDCVTSPQGKQIMQLMQGDQVQVIDERALQPYWALLHEQQGLHDKYRPGKR